MNQLVHIETTSQASPEQVFALLGEVETWPTWSGFDEAGLEQEGPADRQGVGAIRKFRRGRQRSREEVVAFEPPSHFAYRLLSGLPIKDYRADVTLTPLGAGGTTITWHSTFEPKWPGSGWVFRRALSYFIRRTAGQLARAAEAVRP